MGGDGVCESDVSGEGRKGGGKLRRRGCVRRGVGWWCGGRGEIYGVFC